MKHEAIPRAFFVTGLEDSRKAKELFKKNRTPLSCTRYEHMVELAEPLYQSKAFQRLESITFLGILSPRFHGVIDSPLFHSHSIEMEKDDGSRADHSLGVAFLAFSIASDLGLSLEGQRYATAWGLLHDIATWPLSHTGEAAFSALTLVGSKELREKMIIGSKQLPQEFCLNRNST